MQEEKFVNLGKIVRPHGIRGEVKAQVLEEYLEDIVEMDVLFLLGPKQDAIELDIEDLRLNKEALIIKFAGVETMNDAEKLRNYMLRVPRSHLPEMEDGEYLVSDLVGLGVYTEDGVKIGELADVLSGGIHDIYEIRRLEEGAKNCLIPAVKEFIRSIDIPGGRIVISPIDGMIEN